MLIFTLRVGYRVYHVCQSQGSLERRRKVDCCIFVMSLMMPASERTRRWPSFWRKDFVRREELEIEGEVLGMSFWEPFDCLLDGADRTRESFSRSAYRT